MNTLFTYELQTIAKLYKFEIARLSTDKTNVNISADLEHTLDKIEVEISRRIAPDNS